MDPSLELAIGTEADDALAANRRRLPDVDLEAFLATSRRLLLPVLAEQVEHTIRDTSSDAETSVVGWDPGDD